MSEFIKAGGACKCLTMFLAATATGRNIGFPPVWRAGVPRLRVVLAKFRRAWVRAGLALSRPYRFALGLQCLFDLAQRQTIHDILFLSAILLRAMPMPKPQILETLGAVSVGINYAFHSLFFSARPPAPVEIKPFGAALSSTQVPVSAPASSIAGMSIW